MILLSVNPAKYNHCASAIYKPIPIDKMKDHYKDFITLEITSRGHVQFTTSSAEYSEAISDIFAGYGRIPKGNHQPCQRVEDEELLENIKKVIKIHDKQQ